MVGATLRQLSPRLPSPLQPWPGAFAPGPLFKRLTGRFKRDNSDMVDNMMFSAVKLNETPTPIWTAGKYVLVDLGIGIGMMVAVFTTSTFARCWLKDCQRWSLPIPLTESDVIAVSPYMRAGFPTCFQEGDGPCAMIGDLFPHHRTVADLARVI